MDFFLLIMENSHDASLNRTLYWGHKEWVPWVWAHLFTGVAGNADAVRDCGEGALIGGLLVEHMLGEAPCKVTHGGARPYHQGGDTAPPAGGEHPTVLL